MIRNTDYYGLSAVEFSKGDYTALVVPGVGANLIRLANTRLGVEILRTPQADEIETFLGRPHVYGLPVLFPPNRIADGQYLFNGRTYQFPITIAKENNYHHGILKSQPFVVSKACETDDGVLIECRYYSNAANDAVYRHFPHDFKCKMIYRLTDNGLEHEIMFGNKGAEPMPVGVGFHTPIRIPFAGGEAGDYRMRVAVGLQTELDWRGIPTGRLLPLSARFAKLRDEGLQTTECEPIEAGFTAQEIDVEGAPFRGAVIENIRTGTRVFYETDDKTLYWMIWNNKGDQPYCCPEPQSWAIDAPNAPDPEAAGFRSIPPGGKWSMRFRLYAK